MLNKFIKETLKEYINEQIENKTLYHGSNKEFDSFDDKLISTGEGSDLFGKGYYFTDNKDVAEFYAKLKTKKDKIKKYDNSGLFKTEVPIYQDDADDYSDKNKKINTFKISGNILNSEEFIIDDKFKEVIINSFEKYSGLGKDSAIKTFNFLKNNKNNINNFRGELEYIIKQLAYADKNILNDIIGYINGLGYQGIKYRPDKDFEGNQNSWNYVIFDKNIIKK